MEPYYKRLSKKARTLVAIISAMFILQLAFLIHLQLTFMLAPIIIVNALVLIGFIWSMVYVLNPGVKSQNYFRAMIITLCLYIVLEFIVFSDPNQTIPEELLAVLMFACLILLSARWKEYHITRWYSYTIILAAVLKNVIHTVTVVKNGSSLSSLKVDLFGVWSFAVLVIMVMICYNDRLRIKIQEQNIEN